MKLVLDLNVEEYDRFLEYYTHRGKVQKNDSVEVVAKKIFMNGLDDNLVYARIRMRQRPDLCVDGGVK